MSCEQRDWAHFSRLKAHGKERRKTKDEMKIPVCSP